MRMSEIIVLAGLQKLAQFDRVFGLRRRNDMLAQPKNYQVLVP